MQPNMFIIGAPKAGTTSLYAYLNDHPQIFMSTPKEPHFWSADLPNMQTLKTETEYQQLFSEANKDHLAIGEGSTNYMFSSVAVSRIRESIPHAKLIVMLRNPLDLIPSYHAQMLYSLLEDKTDFRDAWSLQAARAEGRQIPKTCHTPEFLQYAQVGRLGEQVKRVLSLFPRSQVYTICFDDFVANTPEVYDGVLRFLGLECDGRTSFPTFNARRSQRWKVLAKLIHRPPWPLRLLQRSFFRPGTATGGKPEDVGLIRRLVGLSSRAAKRLPLDPELKREMVATFREDVALLGNLIGRDLSEWLREKTQAQSPSTPISSREAA